jgi:hypothetical protein
MLATFFLTHLWQYMYLPPGEPWYHGEVWPNVYVVLPLAILGYLYFESRHIAVLAAHEELKAAHVEHAEKLDRLLDRFDPETDGGLADVHAALADVRDRLDLSTPGGLKDIADRIDHLQTKE